MKKRNPFSERKNNSIIAAVIDLGSNSLRMTVAQIGGGFINELEDFRRTVRVSEGMGEENTIKPVAFINTIAALKEFNAAISRYNPEIITAVATEALRKAKNSDAFINAVKEQTGISFEIISGEREAELDFAGISGEIKFTECILMDTGGGSCEFIHIKDACVKEIASLPMGGVVLTEKFLEKDIVSAASLFNMFKYIDGEVSEIDWFNNCALLPIVAVGGSNRAMMKIKKKNNYSKDEVDCIYEGFLKSDLETRRKMLKSQGDRADIIIGGLAALVYTVHKLNSSEVYISNKGIRDGLLAELMKLQ